MQESKQRPSPRLAALGGPKAIVSDWIQSVGARYGIALLAVALAAGVRLALDPLLGSRAPFPVFFIAVLVAAWYGGIGPALAAIVLSAASACFLFVDPRNSLLIEELDQQISVGLFVAVSLTAGGLAVALRREVNRTAADVRRERESLQTTFRSIGDAVIVTNEQGQVTYMNPVAESLTGWPLDEAADRPLSTVFHIVNDQTREVVENPVVKVLQSGGIVGLANHTVLIARDGIDRPIDDSAAPIRDERGEICGVVLIFRDVTERRRAEAARRHLAAIVESSEDAIIGKTLDGIITSWNAAADRQYGYSAEEAVGRPISLIVPDERLPELEEILERLARGERIDHYQTVRQHRDGHRLPVSMTISPIRDAADRIVGASAIARDITVHAQAQEARQKAEEQLRIVTDSVPVSLCRCDRQGRYRFVNRAYAERFDMQPHEFVGRPFQEILQPEVSESIQPHIEAALSGQHVEFEVAVSEQRLGERIVRCEYVPDRNASGEVEGWIALIVDVTERRQMEDSLRESERRFARFMQHLPGLAWVKDLEGRYVYANQAAEKAFRTPLDELRGKTDGEIFPPETAGQFEENDGRVLAESAAVQVMETLKHEDGVVHHSLVSKFPIPGNDGSPALIGGMAIDITEQKSAQEALRVSEARSTAILEMSLDAIVTIDSAGLIVEFNPAAEEMFGHSRREAVGRPLAELVIPPAFREQHYRGLAHCVETGEGPVLNERVEMTALRADGSEFPVELAIARIPSAGRPLFTGFIRDITARKRTEDSLRFLADASATLTALVDFGSTLQQIAQLAVPQFADWCVVDIADADGSLQRLAVAHKDPAKAELGARLRDRYPPDPHSSRGAAHVLATGEPEWQAEISDELLEAAARDDEHLRVLRELGMTSYICVPIAAQGGAVGVITFFAAESHGRYTQDDLAVAEDLAHRAGIAIENARLYQQVREADHRKDEFLAMLAHELRNPLAPIRSGLDILAMQSQGDPETLELMQQQVEHLVRLVDDLLDVSRIVRGKVELRREPLQLSAIVRRSAEAVRQIVETRGHDLRLSIPSEAIWLNADPIRLLQIIENLLNNAAKYTDPGGCIEVDVQKNGGTADIRVRDTGIGIEPELLPRVFDLFTQSSRTLDRSQGGLGVGLTLVKNLVEMHGGSVSARSDGPGTGSEFIVRLPTTAPVQPSAKAEPLATTSRNRRILVVDDNVGAARMLSLLISKLGEYQVEQAHDGPSALQKLSELRPDIVLLDIGLPGMNGYEVARCIREQPDCADVLLVALTGYGQEEDRRRSLEAGFDEHLIKPPSQESIERLLLQRRQDGAANDAAHPK